MKRIMVKKVIIKTYSLNNINFLIKANNEQEAINC